MFEWTEDLQVDKGLIDKDHKELLSIANRVLNPEQSEKDPEELKQAIRELYDYVDYHFKHEEALMHECEYPDMGEHFKKHQLIIKDMNATLTKSRTMGELLDNFRKILYGWVISHIMKEDKKIQAYLLKQKPS
ncbi:MAG: hemerythrin family protein [Candidatus Marinimicrobia bacterium]|nr:hemerythrin family protein [Candidatus Neomarinimicrobiota bacterium]